MTRKAVDERVAGSRVVERCENPHARRLARAVGADVTEDLARVDFERHVVDGLRFAEVAVQVPQLDERMVGGRIAADHGTTRTRGIGNRGDNGI